jgi:predicted amidohydrolase
MAYVLRVAVAQMSSQDDVPKNLARAVELAARARGSSLRGYVCGRNEKYAHRLTSVK